MATCVQCRKPIDEGFALCPACGADNRPPGEHSAMFTCKHQFVRDGSYCVLCGAAVDDPDGYTPAARGRAAKLWILASMGFGVLLFLFQVSANLEGFPFHALTHAMYEYKYTTLDMDERSYQILKRTDLGNQVSFGIFFLALCCFGQGIRLWFRLRATDE